MALSTLAPTAAARPRRTAAPPPAQALAQATSAWLGDMVRNGERHARALRPFRPDEFGTGVASPSLGHVTAVNDLLAAVRGRLLAVSKRVSTAAAAAQRSPTRARTREVVTLAETAHHYVRATERVWDFYLELFGQRQSAHGSWLRACDRIALDCYQDCYVGLGTARPVPAPGPFSYMRTGFSPATWRRGIPLEKLGLQLNPFPLIQLPYHRLVNPWTLGAVLHEVSHNLQDDLGLRDAVPRQVGRTLTAAGLPPDVVAVWVRWNRETFADLLAVLLGGPGIVASLLDILARSPTSVSTWNPRGVHPTPVLRPWLSFELLSRCGFAREAQRFRGVWDRAYGGLDARLPGSVQRSAPAAVAQVVDAMCFTRFPSLGDRRLADVVSFRPKEQAMVEEAGGRLARGIDPGVVPERFLIGATRVALERRLATPEVIATHFYRELGQR